MTREDVIKGLNACIADVPDKCWENGDYPACPYNSNVDGCQLRMMKDVAELLKEHEPRVMKVGEVRSWVNSDRVTREPVFIEMRSGVCAWIIDDEVREIPGAENLTSDLYSKTWRCWTSRPTDAHREAVKWE